MLGAGAVAGLGLVAASAAPAAAAQQQGSSRTRTHIVLLGTSGGPRQFADYGGPEERSGTASALVVGDRYYLIDAGEGVLRQLTRAGLGAVKATGRDPLAQLAGVFITHLHSDHVVDVPNLISLGLFNGLGRPERPVPLIGPGDRGILPPLYGDGAEPPVVNPEAPTPGTRAMVEHLIAAYATDYNDRARDNRLPVPHQLVDARDIQLPVGIGADPNTNPHPAMEPFAVFEDELVRVTATLVQHAPVFPAFAFRFDTEDGSVVFSGDTGPSENLVRLARGANVLVHEVIAPAGIAKLYPEPRSPEDEATYQHVLRSHTPLEEVGPIAERAGVDTLVLNHLAPATLPRRAFAAGGKGFSGRTIVGEDLMVLNVGG
ncbi:zinc phosphodiesterase [Arthrobacter crystallopoietes BAB-32]|uniref:Zinc phosphodiesterase n=1 Tax=Arthrobacter crystallopoietes BAB-32 TaxID=1246476 RepID=N1VA73_9MICC|nr:MBL fold metallo-hydrolase [Arthrobacter crystallopoietes]EMY35188.1 zinc phosphodiesterase [Arthrobacter crystallopoietes BAB-32]